MSFLVSHLTIFLEVILLNMGIFLSLSLSTSSDHQHNTHAFIALKEVCDLKKCNAPNIEYPS
jgi:hypothetical protein